MQPEDRVRVLHTIEAGEAAMAFVQGRARVDLDSDTMLRFALVRAVEILGEAAARVSDEQRAATDDIPWGLIVSMRNRLVHAYFAIDHDILWHTAVEEVPALLPRSRSLLQEG